MGNNQNVGSKKSSSASNSPKGATSPVRSIPQIAQQQQKVKDVQLKCQSKLTNEFLHTERMNKWVERENRVNKEAVTKTVTVTEQPNDKKNLSGSEVEECIKFNFISETNEISLKETKSFVCGVNLSVQQPKDQSERVPMDLVCVIDDSGSMSGKKAQLVRKSLKYLLKIMNGNDRICLISFDSSEKILTPFLLNNGDNKAEFKKAIKNVVGRGSTNIEAGMEAGLWMIKNRKEKNPVTCMFLLSDGQDDSSEVDFRVQKLINVYDIKDNFIVNTYGYGADHDATQMRNIAEWHKGGYYYIEDVKKVSEWFVLSISGLMSAVGEEVRITIKAKNQLQTHLSITQVYGGDQLWVKQDYEKGTFEIYLPHLVIGDNKFFVFDCAFASDKFTLNDQNRSLIAFETEVAIRAVKEEYIIRKSDTLQVEYKDCNLSEIKNNSEELYYEEMMVTHSRAVGGLKIKQATDLINQNQDYTQAKNILEEYKVSMGKNKAKLQSNSGMQHLNEDLDDAINKCAPSLFRKASFEKMQVVHCQRRNSITHCEDWNGNQGEIMKKFKNKDICLSDDSCSGSDDDEQQQKPTLQIKKPLQVMKRKTSAQYSADSLSDSDDENLPQQQLATTPPKINKVPKRRTSAIHYSSEDDDEDEQVQQVQQKQSPIPNLNRRLS